ncbi:hybrid sensor histidine kinase/response regulator [Caulobacter vibrioides]|nr:ATP-binding protein [Caulobacter vibrioides]YP_002518439.2 GAF/PAS-family sensor histidine kinase [Caulobacter vibrioides NA1000]ACL96531.2 GAF/PAS-family sensor histidine kinase [Caulobacter vibrioides NA1000]QXZ54017.1 response regulator [Caulobacter vibrioides]
MAVPELDQEAARIRALLDLGILDTPPEQEFDDIVQAARDACQAPIAVLSLIDSDRQWFKARVGIEACETERDASFCAHAVAASKTLSIPDARLDARFKDNRLVNGPEQIRSYLGAPIMTREGVAIGAVAVIDQRPRDWSSGDTQALERLARIAARLIEMRARCELADAQGQQLLNLAAEGVQFRTIFAAMREGVVLQDRSSIILRHNPAAAALLGLTHDQLLGKSSVDDDWRIVDAAGAPLPVEAQPSMVCLATGEPVLNFVLGVHLRDGALRWLSVNSLPIFDKIGEPPNLTVTSFIDVTELRERETELRDALELAERASRVKSQFVANVSHEIRTPLNGVIALASALRQSALTDRQREMVEIIVESGTTLESILSALLDLAKIEAERMELEIVSFGLEDLVRSSTDLFKIKADNKGLGFDVSVIAPPGARYRGDAQKIRQILWNLLANAIKFTDAGEIAVSVTVEGADPAAQTLLIEVRDTGVGLSPEMEHVLFEPFIQGDASATRRFGGTGLGLTICRALARMMGGDIEALARAERGSVFRVHVPVSTAEPEASVAVESEADLATAMTILLVEDNPNNRRVVELLLEPTGAELVMAENGAEALTILATQRFDLILMDMQMPVMDGLTATREVRCLEAREGEGRTPTPIVMMTANASREHRDAAFAAGADGFITKPVTPATLYAGINTALTAAA